MSTKLHGKIDLSQVLAALPEGLERNVLRGALKAAADVFADGARELCPSEEVRETIKTSSRAEPGLVTAKVQTKGPGQHKAPWLEYGTDEHEIAVKDDKRSLYGDGKYFGRTVHHPGARARPFMRPPLVAREAEAVDAMVGYARKRLTKEGLLTPAPEEPEE